MAKIGIPESISMLQTFLALYSLAKELVGMCVREGGGALKGYMSY